MQENLRLIILSLVGLIIIWFMVMVVDIHMFLHTDADDLVFGVTSMNSTDIGDRCGTEYVNSRTLVDFKLSPQSGQIFYLCPPGLLPIRTKVVANTLSDTFRKQLTPAQQIKVLTFYPVAQATPVAPVANPATENTAPLPMSNTPPPVQSTTTPIPSAAPANNE
jgi:hypothetical protein